MTTRACFHKYILQRKAFGTEVADKVKYTLKFQYTFWCVILFQYFRGDETVEVTGTFSNYDILVLQSVVASEQYRREGEVVIDSVLR